MRIGTAYAQQSALDGMMERQTEQLDAYRQLSSGKRVTKPSDDPVAAAEAERVRSREARIEAEKRSTSHVQQMLAGADSALGDATEVLQTMRETLLEASRTTASPSDRASYAASLRQAREQLLSIANRPDGSGGFIFGGQGSPGVPVAASGTAYAPLAGSQQVGQEMVSPVTLDGRENFTAVRTQTGTESIFAQLDGAIAVLENTAAPGATLVSTVGGVVDSVDRSIDRLGTTRTMVGERMRAVDAHAQALESGSIENQARLSELVDVDFARAASNLSTSQTSYEAALKSYAQISRLSLFNFL
jgi:flagellar hook-associated protein 3 FlgL